MTADLIKRMVVETVYLLNKFEEIAFRRTPGSKGTWFAKQKGLFEYPIKANTVIVNDAVLEEKYLTEEQYQKY